MQKTESLFDCNKASLIRLAALVWFTGVIVLLFKSSGMIIESINMGAPVFGSAVAVFTGLLIGAIKARYLFIRLCRQNIKRILALNGPKIWQFYRARFFFFLVLMITLGDWAYQLSNTNYVLLLLLSMLELSISTALLISAKCFLNKLL